MKTLILKTILPSLLVLSNAASAMAFLAPSRPLPAGAYAATDRPQDLMVIESGLASLEKRLQMIASATRSIDTEFFIYKADKVGRLYTQALIEKARKGIKVRVLIDRGFNNENLDNHYAKILLENQIDVRFYNQTSLINVKQANHRTHRKSLIIDGAEAIIGGRNMADEYFDFSAKFNLIDRDVVVKGSIVQDITQSFENFWSSNLSRNAENVEEPKLSDYGLQSEQDAQSVDGGQQALAKYKTERSNYLKAMTLARNFIVATEEDLSSLARIRKYAVELLQISPRATCQETYYYADTPGTGIDARVVKDQILLLTATAKKSIAIESPFFIQKAADNMFSLALARGVKVQIMTNSLYSTDTPISVAPFLSTAKMLTAQGASVYIHEGAQPSWLDFSLPEAKTAVWGTHAKSIVIDDDTILIGSFNMDPRSANLNAEMALVCRGQKDLAAALNTDFERRKSIMVKLDQNGNPVDGRSKNLDASSRRRLMYQLTAPIAHIFDFWL